MQSWLVIDDRHINTNTGRQCSKEVRPCRRGKWTLITEQAGKYSVAPHVCDSRPLILSQSAGLETQEGTISPASVSLISQATRKGSFKYVKSRYGIESRPWLGRKKSTVL